MQSLRVKFILAAFVASFFAIGMAGLLNYFKFKSTADGVLLSRMQMIGANIESNIRYSLALGLAFPEISTLPELIGREKAADALIRDIDIFDNEGRIAYSTEPGRVGQKVAEQWQGNAIEAANKAFWRLEDDAYLGVGIGLQNNFGVTVGQLLIRYSRASFDREVMDTGRHLLLYAVCGLAGALIVLVVALGVVYRSFVGDTKILAAGDGRPAALRQESGEGC